MLSTYTKLLYLWKQLKYDQLLTHSGLLVSSKPKLQRSFLLCVASTSINSTVPVAKT